MRVSSCTVFATVHEILNFGMELDNPRHQRLAGELVERGRSNKATCEVADRINVRPADKIGNQPVVIGNEVAETVSGAHRAFVIELVGLK